MFNKIMAAFSAAVAGLSIVLGIDIYEHHIVAKKVGTATKDLKEASVKEIQQSIVEQAVKNAAAESVGVYVGNVKSEIMNEARINIGNEVRKSVESMKAVTEKEVLDKISEEASMIDMTALKKSARDKAEQRILDKFDGNLEDLLQKFNENLSNVQKIYGGIAEAITKTKEKESNGIKFTIG